MQEYKDVRKFTITRSSWYRGQGSMYSCMFNDKGERCCLGFYAAAVGIPDELIKNCSDPLAVIMPDPFDSTIKLKWKTFLIEGSNGKEDCSSLAREIIAMNDDAHIPPGRREKKLIKLFKRGGVRVIFQD